MNAPIRVAVTGAAGQIGYSLLFRIASGAMFGPDQPVILHLIEIEPALKALNGVVMELDDCAFPLLAGVVPTASLDEGFRGVNWALLADTPPSTGTMAPFTNDAAGEVRNTSIAATSGASPQRPSGICRRSASCAELWRSRPVMPVWMGPGQTALMRMPERPSSSAAERTKLTTPPLAAL